MLFRSFQAVIKEQLKESACFVPAHLMRQRAGAAGARALEYLKQGRTVSARLHKPDYLRLSQAERERKEKEQAEMEQN